MNLWLIKIKQISTKKDLQENIDQEHLYLKEKLNQYHANQNKKKDKLQIIIGKSKQK